MTLTVLSKAMCLSVGLWGLVNNAGVATFGDLEWLPISTYKKISEVNVFGMINATQAFLPLIRKAKGNKLSLYVI